MNFIVLVVKGQQYKKAISISSQNDAYLLGKQDRYYTNGLFFQFDTKVDSKKSFHKATRWELGQMIFTAFSGAVPLLIKQDRPFAGYLFIKKTNTYFFTTKKMLGVSLTAGVLGPSSYAKETVTLIHRVFNLYKPDGWQHQIPNEVAIGSGGVYTWLLKENENADIALEHTANLSNVFSNAGTAVVFRAGKFDKGLLNTRFFNPVITGKANNGECFLYLKIKGQYILYDATIQGRLFHKGEQEYFDKEPFIASVEPGLFLSKNRLSVNCFAMISSRQVKNSKYAKQQYGSITLSYHFPRKN